MNQNQDASVAEAPQVGASAVLETRDPMEFEAPDWDQPWSADGSVAVESEDEKEEGDEADREGREDGADGEESGEDEPKKEEESAETLKLGEDEVPVAHVVELWQEIKEVMADETAASLLKEHSMVDLIKRAGSVDAEKSLTYDAMVDRIVGSAKGAKETIGHLIGFALNCHPKELEGFADELDLSAITNPEDLSPTEQAFYMAARTQADIAKRLGEQAATLAEELAALKKNLGERDLEPKLAEAVAKALPGQAPTGPEVRAAMKKHQTENPVSAWRLELLERGEAEAAGKAAKGGGPAPQPSKVSGPREFDPTGMKTDEVIRRINDGQTPVKRKR